MNSNIEFFWKKLLIVFLVWVSFLSCQSQTLDKAEQERDLILSVFLILGQNHFLQKNFNQDFFDEVLNNYLQLTDWNKIFYIQSDIDLFQQLNQYPNGHANPQQEILNRIPNLLKVSYTSYDIFSKRASQFQQFAEDYLSREIDFSVEEDYIVNAEKRSFATDEEALPEVWRRYLKYLTLNRIITVSPRGEKGNPVLPRTNEINARAHILNQMKSLAQNVKTRKPDQYIEFYLNGVGMAYDQYTTYFSPVEKETFNIQMTGQLEGIGAQISKVEDGLIEIKGIVTGGPTYKQKALEIGDKIMKIDDGNGNMLDVISLSMNDALTYIRGKKGTVARFVVKRIDGVIENVEIIRGRVILEETYARSAILQTQIPGDESRKIGYLYLPSFYGDPRRSSGPNSSDDVKRELLHLNSQGVDGMIFDLRNNGGGYLEDAVNISGFFIKEGPIVRIRGREGEFKPKSDTDPAVFFTKPMVVLINENSASASEIFSAAMQDYGRAVIVGSPQSFGKATVQTVLEYDKQPYFKQIADIAGSLKYTIQKYYRVTGKSTQTIGVIPDIILPTLWVKADVKKDAYAQDSLPEISFPKWNQFSYDLPRLRKEEESRLKKSPFFNNVEKRLEILKERKNEDVFPLSYKEAKSNHDLYLDRIDKYDLNISKSQTLYTVLDEPSPDDNQRKRDDLENWKKQIFEDFYLEEGVMILNDILR